MATQPIEELVAERERVKAIFSTMTQLELKYIPLDRLIRLFRIRLGKAQIWKLRSDFIKGGDEMSGKDEWVPKPENIGAQIVIEKLAGVSSKTYAHLGDGEQIGSEDALRMINKILTQYDASILSRNLKRKLPK
ncbi:MAG: hypothetical protein WBV94_06905 [Blastocatellia bacterium]